MITPSIVRTKSREIHYRIQFRRADGRVTSRTFPTLREAEVAAAKVACGEGLDQLDAGGCGVSIRAQCERRIAELATDQIGASTVRVYTSVVTGQIVPFFGDDDLTTLDVDRILAWRVWMAEPSRTHGPGRPGSGRGRELKGYAPSTRKLANRVLRLLIRPAVGELLPTDPFASDRLRTRNRNREELPERQVVTRAQLHRLAAHTTPPYDLAVLIMGYLGLRWSELVGLRRVDVHGDVLSVSGQLLYGGRYGGWYQAATKTHRKRSISMPAVLVERLAAHVAALPPEQNILFPNPRGAPMSNSWWASRVFHPALRAAGLPHMRTHDLRHSAASIMLGEDLMPIKTVAMRLGHASIQMTGDVYGHLEVGHDRVFMERQNEAFRAADAATRYDPGC